MQRQWSVTEEHCSEWRVVTVTLATLQKKLYEYRADVMVTQKDGLEHYIQYSTSLIVICFGKRRETYLGNESS